MKNESKFNHIFGIVTYPVPSAGIPPLSHLIRIISSIGKEIIIISPFDQDDLEIPKNFNNQFYKINYSSGKNFLSKIFTHILLQLTLSFRIAKYKNVDVWIFFLDAHYLILPVLTTKILRKQTIFLLASSIKNSNKAKKDLLWNISIYSENITLYFSDILVIYSDKLIKSWNLERFTKKIFISHEHFLDFNEFKKLKTLEKRKPLIGFIGRLSEEKGILNFVKAITLIPLKESNVTFFIGGDGPLKEEIIEFCKQNKIYDRIVFSGWVSHDKLPTYLNELKLLVVPSYSEGLPNIILESMACGTPVLANPVGAIPDLIEDMKTGFLMKDNSPECIAENINRALDYSNLEQISKNAYDFVVDVFNFKNVVDDWREIIIKVKNMPKLF